MTKTTIFTPILIAGCTILMISFAIRASFGIFQIPIATEFGWPRADFSTAIAIQNLAWGIGQPMFSAFGERFGDRKAIIIGALLYALGLLLSAYAVTPGQHQALAILVGFGIAGTGFGIILPLIGRAASQEKRSLTLGIGSAIGSAGQVIGPPAAEALLQFLPWQSVFMIFAAVILTTLLALPFLRAPAKTQSKSEPDEPMLTVVTRAFRDPTYTLIFLGFFSCGYQLGFITAHFPAFITEVCGLIDPTGMLAGIGIATTSALGAVAIAVIGIANIGGSVLAGWMGGRFPKKYLLAAIYAGRTIASAIFILLPMTPTTVLVYSGAMGAMWLATVPLTSGLVGHIYGMRYMGTLYGFVFLSHQIGSFIGIWLGGRLYDLIGIWLGGRLYDLNGSYTLVWWVGVGVGAFSAIIHLPIRERPMVVQAA
ncbi:MAG: MFS transporter [Rhodobacterales bacterium]|nr:MFS transporter [Rhodobacterales bacterium]